MKRNKLHIIWLIGLLLFVSACGDDEYHYPSVKLDFVTVKSGVNGKLQTLLPDKGGALAVSKDRTNSTISPNNSKRVLANYEVTSSDGVTSATIYSLQSLVTLTPKFKGDPGYGDLTKTDPIDVVSIWMGRDYLNIILSLKAKGGVQHIFDLLGEVQEESENGEKVVVLSLYHDANGDPEYYNRRAYISVPLTKLAGKPDQVVRIKFKYYTSDKDGNIVESDKYSNADFKGFEYISDAN
ncbi:NigD-like protein [Bacteroides sp.]|uniref:NigD-like protein n=1 Tax=Bacteroides sp. TaxID=29523 RepID=UPI00261DF3AB|nr:NigD-like protein [Bacteroides sp.]MDD3038519.1 NigD-like protein [Bacteroides sp.]